MRVPRSVEEALEFDKNNKNDFWKESIVREIEALMGHNTFKFLSKSAKTLKKEGFEWAPLRMIFDVKSDGRLKSRLVIGGHVLDSENLDTYASVMKAISQRLLMVIASANNYDAIVGDITNAYLYADADVKVYTRVGKEFEIAGFPELPNQSLAQIVRALYGLPSSGRAWHKHLAKTLRKMGFKPTRFDPDVYIRDIKEGTGWDYLGVHTDDVTAVAVDARGVMDELMGHYDIKKSGEPTYHLGCDYKKVTHGGNSYYEIGSVTHVNEAVKSLRL